MPYYTKESLNSLINVPLFLIWPFGAFIGSLKHIGTKWNALVFISFCTLFGYAFQFDNTSADSYRVAMTFVLFDKSISEVMQAYIQGGYPDLYRYLVYSVLKNLGIQNPKVAYAFFGFTFGVFWYLSLKIFFGKKIPYFNFFTFLLIFFFFFINPIINVNGARFNTAAWVCFYSSIKLVLYNEKKWILGLACSALIHFSFIAIIPFIILYAFFHNFLHSKRKIYKPLLFFFILSFVISQASPILRLNNINNYINISNSIDYKLKLYNSDNAREINTKRKSNSTFLKVSKVFAQFQRFYYFFLILYLWRVIQKVVIKDESFIKYFGFLVFFCIIGNVLNLIPTGGRFIDVASIFVLYGLMRIHRVLRSRTLQYFILFLVPIYSFNILFYIFLTYSLITPDLWSNNLIFLIEDGKDFIFH